MLLRVYLCPWLCVYAPVSVCLCVYVSVSVCLCHTQELYPSQFLTLSIDCKLKLTDLYLFPINYIFLKMGMWEGPGKGSGTFFFFFVTCISYFLPKVSQYFPNYLPNKLDAFQPLLWWITNSRPWVKRIHGNIINKTFFSHKAIKHLLLPRSTFQRQTS